MPAKAPIAVLLAVLVGFGLFGLLQPGPAPGERPEDVARKQEAVPLKMGDWQGSESERTTKDEADMRVAGAKASLNRRYKHTKTGEEVAVLVLYGIPAEMGAHSPQVCYRAIGFKECTGQQRSAFGESGSLWFTKFEALQNQRDVLGVYWGWGTGGAWNAAENPRTTFSDRSLIYKVYLQRTVGLGSKGEEDPALRNFAEVFLKALERPGA